MRKTITSLCTLLLLAGCSPQHLRVNSSPDAPVVRKDERGVIADLRQLVAEAEAEDAWLYVPETKECHDIGLETTETEGVAMTVDYSLDKIRNVAAKHKRLRFYHIHPIKPFERIMRPNLESPPEGYTAQRVKELLDFDNSTPSPQDMGVAIYLSCLYQHHQSKDLRYRLASQDGITEYKPKMKELFDFCEFTEEKYLYHQGMTLGENVAERMSLESVEERIKRAVATKRPVHLFRNKYMDIIFWPYEAIGLHPQD